MLVPLSNLVGECGEMKTTRKNKVNKKPWHWDSIHQIAFDNVKSTITKEVVLAYPDFMKPFEIYTDASTKQLGAVITQENRPIAFFSRKLSVARNQIHRHQTRTLSHCGNTNGVQRNAVGTTDQCLH
jgi:hypothetical protein